MANENETLDDILGEASFTGGRRKIFKIKDGDGQVYRIIGPYKSCKKDGKWAIYHNQHYGYKVQNKRDPSKFIFRTFECPRERNQEKMIIRDCAECCKNEEQNELMEARRAEIEKDIKEKRKKYTKEDVEEILGPLKNYLRDHNLDRKWWLNVKSDKGEYGVLLIAHKQKQALEAEMDRLEKKEGISRRDCISPNKGVWFDFGRKGMGRETQHTVNAVYETEIVNGKQFRTVKLAPLTQTDVTGIQEGCIDLNEAVRKLTSEQVEALVATNNDPEEVEKIFNMGQPSETSASPKPAPRHEPKPEPKVDEAAELRRQLAELQAKLAAASDDKSPPKEEAKPEPKPEPKAEEIPLDDPEAMTDEQIAALFSSQPKDD